MTIVQHLIPSRILAIGAVVAFGLVLSGCATFPRLERPDVMRSDQAAPIGFPTTIRFSGFDAAAFAKLINESSLRKHPGTDSRGSMLALSGGGAGGAFGAGAIVGLSRTGNRPAFDIVTGVSTGALVAPFALLGPSWDPQLEDAFTGNWTDRFLAPNGIASLFATALYRGGPLRNLVRRLVTPQLLEAVAAEWKTGRYLLIVTTNMDLGEAVVWNMGAIAAIGGEQALRLFQNVMIASASLPGVFPPVMIPVEHEGRRYEEMHADGGATIPFFVVAASQTLEPAAVPNRADVFVIINGPLSTPQQTTKVNTIAIAQRGFSALLYQTFRSELLRITTLAKARDSMFRFTMVPMTYRYAGSLDFDRDKMRQLFNYGLACAAAGELWIGGGAAQERSRGPSNACPTKSLPAN